jgi:hypothetical protein
LPNLECIKAGGAKCLTLRLDGEDAAAWKQSERTSEAGQLVSVVVGGEASGT